MRWLRNALRTFRLLAHLLLGAVLAGLLFGSSRRDTLSRRHRLLRWWHGRLCRILALTIDSRGTPAEAPCLSVANHVSWLDIPVLLSLSPGSFVAKQEVRGWPLIGWLSARAGTLFITRGRRGAAKDTATAMSWRLRQGERVLLFPEGTTTDGAGVRRFHGGLFEAAILTGMPVQPVGLSYQDSGAPANRAPFIGDDALLPHLLRILWGDCGLRVEVSFHPPITVRSATRRDLAERARETILSGLSPKSLVKREAASVRRG